MIILEPYPRHDWGDRPVVDITFNMNNAYRFAYCIHNQIPDPFMFYVEDGFDSRAWDSYRLLPFLCIESPPKKLVLAVLKEVDTRLWKA